MIPNPLPLLPLIEFLRPSRSPHLVASAIGVFATCYLLDFVDDSVSDGEFILFAIPVYFTLLLIVFFSFKDISVPELEDVENHFRFSRAMGIGSAILAIAMIVVLMNEDDRYYRLAYSCALVQLVTFILYSLIRLIKEESSADIRIFQISFMMFIFLIAGVFCLNGAIDTEEGIFFTSDGFINRFGWTAAFFGLLWAVYEAFWIRRVLRIVEFRVLDTTEPVAGAQHHERH